jgi:hypothetical protein
MGVLLLCLFRRGECYAIQSTANRHFVRSLRPILFTPIRSRRIVGKQITAARGITRRVQIIAKA